MDDQPPDPESVSTFSVLKQRLHFDFSLSPRRVKGKATIEIQPQDEHLRYIQLHCRQLKITSVCVDGHDATRSTSYSNLYDRLALYPRTDIHQHHFIKQRLRRHAEMVAPELEIVVPDAVKIKRMNPEDATVDQVAANAFGADGENLYTPIKVEIEYILEDPRDALQFVGVEEGDARYPHVFTRNSPYQGTASCLFPCVDDGTTKCIFEISICYPRTLGDAYGKRQRHAALNGTAMEIDSPKADSVMSDVDDDPAEFTDEEKALEMSVICSGELTDDILNPDDPSRKTASFTCAVPVLPQHIGIALGPFGHVDLSEYRDTQDDERLGSNAIRVHAFCLPGREDEVQNSAMMLARTLDSFTERYQSYPFEKAYKLAFVDDLECDVAHSASFSICSSRLLFTETVWEPLEPTTRTLVHAVASQWIGINVTPQRPQDNWVIVGASWFMAELYLRDLFGRNDHRFRQKQMVDRIIESDIRRPSLFILGEYLNVDPAEAEFMTLKAPMVLSILHNRLVKQSGRNGVDRCLYRLLFNARNEKLPNGMISTEGFLEICEKVGHQKLDTFFNQWIYGSGCPTFECHPVFNKKKQVIQLTIKQTQADPSMKPEERPLSADDVIREGKEKTNGFRPSSEWPAFVGPMTIRIHEADGTPYEHIVDINSSTVKVEIPYNTKYKRLKKSRRDKERAAAAAGLDASGEAQEDTIIYMLGDVLESREEMAEWQISEWSPEDEARMEQEFYEWLRVDADFEWICRTNINDMPAYMYVSQLQQDKDVMAQTESIQWLALKEGHPLISSILLKTLMDHRYFWGIRDLAAQVIAASAKAELEWIGFFHLKKAFQELFCLPGSSMTRPNDFSDRTSYIIQCAIPKAIAKIKDKDGKSPIFVKSFILDLMRYNDNRGNEFSDDHYISVLMSCLAQTLTTTRRTNASQELSLSIANEEADFMKKALDELGRHQRLDEWIPTFQNTYTTTALDCGQMLMLNRAIPAKPSEFLQYARAGNADHVRLKAWDCLVNLGMVRHDSIIKFIVHEICTDRSPYFRARLIRILEHGLGQVAVGDVFKLDKIKAPADGGLEIQQEDVLPNREDQVARRKLEGALRALKADLGGNTVLKESLEKALHSTITSARDVAELLEICTMIYPTKNSLVSVLKLPKYWKVQHLGNGQLRFFHSGRYRERLPKKPEVPVVAPPAPVVPLPPPQDAPAPPAPAPTKSLKIKLKPPAPGGFVAADGRTPTPSQESTRPNLVPPKPPTPREPQPPALPSPKPTLAAPLPPAKTTTPSAAQDRDRKSKPNLKVAPPPPPSRPEPPSRSRPPTPAGARPPSGSGSRPPTPTTQTQTQQRPNLKFSSSSRPSSRPGTPTGGPPSPAVPPAALAQGGGGGKIRLVNKKSGQSTSKMSQRAQQGQGQAPPSQPAALNRTAGATPAQSSGAGASKKSLIVKLRLAPEKLARVVRRQAQAQVSGSSSTGADARPEKGHGQKRKAKGENEEGKVRGLKRQASVPGEAGGAGESRNKGTGASAAAAGGAKPRKVVKLRIGRANAEVVRGRFGR